MKSLSGLDLVGATNAARASAQQNDSDMRCPSTPQPVDELSRIEAALRRLDLGKFGLCLYCGDQISLKRLDRDPAISSCGTCAED